MDISYLLEALGQVAAEAEARGSQPHRMEQKRWGRVIHLLSVPGTRVDLCFVNQGGECSVHEHMSCWNRIVCLRGSVELRLFHDRANNYDTVRLVDLEDQNPQVTDIPPGRLHQFYSEEGCVLLEIYWCEPWRQDIVRVPGT